MGVKPGSKIFIGGGLHDLVQVFHSYACNLRPMEAFLP